MVVVPGTNLDTSNPNDVVEITTLVTVAGKMTLTQLIQFDTVLQRINRTPFEMKLLSLILVAMTRLQDLKQTYEIARSQGGIWCRGSLFSYDERGEQQGPIQSELAQASRAHTELDHADYATRVLNIAQQQNIEASLGDCEVKVLQDLSDYIHNPHPNIPTSSFQHMPVSLFQLVPSRIYIIISGSMGPCDDCKGRIEYFIVDLQTLATSLKVSIPLFLEVNYTTETNSVNRMQYGYPNDIRIRVGNGGHPTSPLLPDDFFYWSKTLL